MQHKAATWGFSLIELLVSVAIILILLTAVCAAIIQTLRLEAVHASRAGMGRTTSQLAARLQEDARSSTAVFIPGTDVLGNANGGATGAHEVDFFRKLSAGGEAYVAYRFDQASNVVTRFEYSYALGKQTILNSDIAGSDIESFALERQPVASSDLIADQADATRVSILYGRPELVGGNDIVVVSVTAEGSGGVPSKELSIHLAAGAAPTSLAVLAPAGPPPTAPPTHVIPFVLLRPGFQLHLPHGPIHWGDPGDPSGSIHWVAAVGTAQFLGGGPDNAGTWFELSSLYPVLTTGNFIFHLSDGSSVTASINCVGMSCPAFRVAPVSASGFTPRGGVAFQTML